MDKKKITIILVTVLFFLIIGIGFNSVFSRVNKNKNLVKDQITKSQGIEIDENYKESIEENNEYNTFKNDESDKVETEEDKYEANLNENEHSSEYNQVVENNDQQSQVNQQEDQVQHPQKKDIITIAISCKTAINNGVNSQSGFTHLPTNGEILATSKVEIEEGETVFEVLQKTVLKNGIHMEYTGAGSSIYIEGIDNLYEFDGGKNSGWMYSVNGWYPNYGCGSYKLKADDIIQWNYTCDLGNDLGAGVN